MADKTENLLKKARFNHPISQNLKGDNPVRIHTSVLKTLTLDLELILLPSFRHN